MTTTTNRPPTPRLCSSMRRRRRSIPPVEGRRTCSFVRQSDFLFVCGNIRIDDCGRQRVYIGQRVRNRVLFLLTLLHNTNPKLFRVLHNLFFPRLRSINTNVLAHTPTRADSCRTQRTTRRSQRSSTRRLCPARYHSHECHRRDKDRLSG